MEDLIIDTDPGIDDAIAIAIAVSAPTLNVKLITTVAGNVDIDKVTYNAQRLLEFLGRSDIPVAKGCSRPLINPIRNATSVHGLSGMEGWDFPEPQCPLHPKHAVEAMRETLVSSDTPITIMAIGPLTNLAMLLRMYPECKEKIQRIVFMGGSMNRGNSGVMSEFNIDIDPEAAHIVFHSGIPLVMAGLDMGLKALVYPEDSELIRKQNHTGEMAYALFKKYRGGSFQTGLKMYDATAVAYILQPSLYQSESVYVDVELQGVLTRGCTTVDLKGYLKKEPNIEVLTDIDSEAFREWIIASLARCN